MLTASDIFRRVLNETYLHLDLLSSNRDLCHVLDLAIACIGTEDDVASSKTDSCSGLWLLDMCWPSTPFNRTVHQSCQSSYSSKGSDGKNPYNVSLYCNASTGEWDKQHGPFFCAKSSWEEREHTKATLFNNTQSLNESETLSEFENDETAVIHNLAIKEAPYNTLGRFVTIGYSMSIVSLLIALILLFFLKRLHCTRIFIHMNLMVSFILRGLLWIFHEVAFQSVDEFEEKAANASLRLVVVVFGSFNSSDLSQLFIWKETFCDPYDQSNYFVSKTWCRLYFVCLHYSVTANYYWLLAEGLYLCLLLRAMNPNTDHKVLMRAFLVLGWGLPWLSVLSATVVKLLDSSENESCWSKEENSIPDWIIKIPIVLSLVLNFGIFILVVSVVGSKLKVNLRHHAGDDDRNYKWRLAKSTLALIPLLGIQYLITVFFDFANNDRSLAAFVKHAIELTLASSQGLLVALIYCFFNGEIQAETKRSWYTWKTDWNLKLGSRKRKRSTISQTSLTNIPSNMARKVSATSTTSAMRKSSYTLVPNIPVRRDSNNSPTRTRYCTNVMTGIMEQQPSPDTSTIDSSSDVSYSKRESAILLYKGENSLSVPAPNTKFPCRFDPNGSIKRKTNSVGDRFSDCSINDFDRLLTVSSVETSSGTEHNSVGSCKEISHDSLSDTVL